MTKKIAIGLAVILAIVLPLFLIDRVLFAPEREKNSRINEVIYTRFRAIENYCLAYIKRETVNQTELERCKKVVELDKFCSGWASTDQTPSDCYADKYYKNLQSLGFDLPELYNKKEK